MSMDGRKYRTEHKYYLHIHDYAAMRHKISALLPMDPHSIGPEGYCIRSLYFDGPHDHALHDKNNGIFAREKYRIRIYNGSDSIITVERKSKRGDYVCKESARISRDEYEQVRQGHYGVLRKMMSGLLHDFHAALAYRGFRPTTIVEYWREAYIYEHGNVRITFDKKLSASINTYDLFDEHMALAEVIEVPRTIMEVKFDSYLPDMIRMLLQPYSQHRSSISKYVLCRELNFLHFKE